MEDELLELVDLGPKEEPELPEEPTEFERWFAVRLTEY